MTYSYDYIHLNPTTFNIYKRQHFCFPSDVISYILKNPHSANGLLKIQKTCKYFFAKNRILALENVEFFNFSFSDKHISWFISGRKYTFQNSIKWWLTKELKIEHKKILSDCVYRCSLKSLEIRYETLTLKEFDFLLNGGKMKRLYLMETNITDDENGLHVPIDKILAKIPNIKYFLYDFPEEIYSTETFEKMDLLKFNSKFKSFYLTISKLSNDANISLLSKFISNNAGNVADFAIHFLDIENKGHYLTTLQTAVDKTFQSWDTENKPKIVIY